MASHVKSSGTEGASSLSPILLPIEPVRSFLRPILEKLLHIKTAGLENMPKEGGAILVCNHTDYMDVIIQVIYSPRKLVFLAKNELSNLAEQFQRFIITQASLVDSSSLKFVEPFLSKSVGIFLSWIEAQSMEWGSLPIERAYHEKVGIKESSQYYNELQKKLVDFLKEGNVLSIFPEGTRSQTGLMSPFKSAFARIAIEAQVPVIPSAINGVWKFSTMESLLSGQVFRSLIQYNMGKAFLPDSFPEFASEKEKKRGVKELTKQIAKKVYALSLEAEGDDRTKGSARKL